MKRSHLLVAGAALVFSGALISSDAAAQQPQPGQPPAGQPQPGQPIIVRQPGQVPGQPIGPNRGQPGGRPGQPTIIRRPSAPTPGVDPHAPNAHGGEHGDGEGHGAEHGGHCPGHGPEDPPPHINWYQGLVGVDNDKSQNGTPLQKVLYRYKNDQDECDPKNQEPPLLAAVINLGIVLYLLVRLGKTPIKEGLLKRKKTLMQDMESA
ncbi:MAG TPA: F0F1 ATP synthase subunit B, partial [Polyangiaceae bacterium]|nr:F0F1 ATP synthase subunit B [Polyangiaceae bacterium]